MTANWEGNFVRKMHICYEFLFVRLRMFNVLTFMCFSTNNHSSTSTSSWKKNPVKHIQLAVTYSCQLVGLNNMPVMGSSPKWTVPPYVGLTILLWGVIHKSLKAKLLKWYRQALTDSGCWAKEEEINWLDDTFTLSVFSLHIYIFYKIATREKINYIPCDRE